jgi:hypothetical protein
VAPPATAAAPAPATAAPTPPAGAPAAREPPRPPAASAPRQRRQVAQAEAPARAEAPAAAAAGDPKAILDRADALADRREGSACLAALAALREVPADMAARAQEIRGDCEMLAGNCEAGRRILQPMYEADRRFSPEAAKGVLSARVARMCPVASFPTVEQRIMAVSLQANEAMSAPGDQSRWCGALQRALLADTETGAVRGCYADKQAKGCASLRFDLQNAYERLAECFLRDKDCREGARLDVMHSQVEWGAIAVDHQSIDQFCRPHRVVEVYPACQTAGEEAERKCRDRVDAARRAGEARVTPAFPR